MILKIYGYNFFPFKLSCKKIDSRSISIYTKKCQTTYFIAILFLLKVNYLFHFYLHILSSIKQNIIIIFFNNK